MLADTLRDYIAACFTGLWIQTYEPDEAQDEIAKLAADQNLFPRLRVGLTTRQRTSFQSLL
jgi:hypothetical protein